MKRADAHPLADRPPIWQPISAGYTTRTAAP